VGPGHAVRFPGRPTGTTLLTVLPGVGAKRVPPLLRAVLADGLAVARSSGEAMYDDMLAAGRVARVAAYRWHLATGELQGAGGAGCAWSGSGWSTAAAIPSPCTAASGT
jgi:hypothetical protein